MSRLYRKAIQDWICQSCNGSNFSHREVCIGCGQKKKPEQNNQNPPQQQKISQSGKLEYQQEQGDWQCKNCNTFNFKKRSSCFKCKQQQQQSGGENQQNIQQQQQQQITNSSDSQQGNQNKKEFVKDLRSEWVCNSCQTLNFKNRDSCFKCRRNKPNSEQQENTQIQQQQSNQNYRENVQVNQDWICGRCNTLNFKNKDKCFECGRGIILVKGNTDLNLDNNNNLQIQQQQQQNSQISNKSDWVCDNCQTLNFKNKMQCFKCRQKKPELNNINNNQNIDINNNFKQDWVCGSCQTLNFKNKVRCFKCKLDKPVLNDNNSQQMEVKQNQQIVQQQQQQQLELNNNNDNDNDNGMEEELTCSICMEIMSDIVSVIPCLHNFCGQCAKDWFVKADNCPSCQKPVQTIRKNPMLNNMVTLYKKQKYGAQSIYINNSKAFEEVELSLSQLRLKK